MKTIYIVDTNILIEWNKYYYSLDSTQEEWKKSYQEWVRKFCEECDSKIFIPDIVWVEFLSVFLHKSIYVEEDYRETMRRFREQSTFVQQMEFSVISRSNWDFYSLEVNPFQDACDLMLDPGIIDMDMFEWLKKSAEKARQKFQTTGPLTYKLLDGMDSAILIYLSELGHIYKDHTVILLTADMALAKVYKKIRQKHSSWVAQNTKVDFTLGKRA